MNMGNDKATSASLQLKNNTLFYANFVSTICLFCIVHIINKLANGEQLSEKESNINMVIKQQVLDEIKELAPKY